MLTRGEADDICAVVAADPECRHRISSVLSFIPSSWGIAGGIRNTGYIALELGSGARLFDVTSPEGAAMVCVGIAEQTARALRRQIGCRAALMRLGDAGTIDRELRGVAHTATLLQFASSRYVFDWHATLDLDDPIIHPSVNAFRHGLGGIPRSKFEGFD